MGIEFPNLDPKMHHDLFKVTDRIRELGMGSKKLTMADYAAIMQQLCASLTMSFEHGLENAILYLGAKTQDAKTVADANAIVRDAKNFGNFLNFEAKLLSACGMPQATVDELIRCIKDFKESIDFSNLNAQKILASVKELQKMACASEALVTAYVDDEKRIYEDKKRALKVYGVSLVAANFSALGFTMGASGPLTAISAGFGGLMLTFEGKLKDPTESPPKRD